MEKLKRFFRRLWLGVRGTSKAALILILCTVVSAGVLGVYLLAAPDETASGTLSPLFPSVKREGIEKILIHNDYGVEYTVKSEYGKDANGNLTESLAFWLEKDGSEAILDDEKLSYLVVGTGQNYVYEPVISAPEAGDADYEKKLALYEQKKKEFGFGGDAPYYELTKRTDGTTLRVYYGETALSGDGYYVMLAGREAIYVTTSTFVGDLLYMAGPETLLSPILYFPSMFQYAYAYPKKFEIYDTERFDKVGTTVSAEYSSVWFTYLAEDGKTLVEDSILLYNTTDADGKEVVPNGLTLALREYLLGMSIGVFGDPEKPDTLPEPFTYTYPDDESVEDEELKGTTVSFTVISVDALERETLRLNFEWNPDRRAWETRIQELKKEAETAEGEHLKALNAQIKELEDGLVGLPMYLFRAPDKLTPYLPETGTAMTMLQNTLEATGTVHRMGLTGEVINELGLYAHRISISYPFSSDYLAGDFLQGELLISESKNGTRFVGSLLTDMVLEVDASVFDFLDENLVYFSDSTVQTVPIRDVETMTFYWNYGADGSLLKGEYVFEITMGLAENNATGETYETVVAVHVTDPSGNRRAIKHKSFNQLFYRLGYSRYAGMLDEEEAEALTQSASTRALGIYYTMRDGSVRFLEFYPVSDGETGNTVLVRTKNSDDGGVGEIFTVYGTTLKDIARGFLTVITGGDLTATDRYS